MSSSVVASFCVESQRLCSSSNMTYSFCRWRSSQPMRRNSRPKGPTTAILWSTQISRSIINSVSKISQTNRPMRTTAWCSNGWTSIARASSSRRAFVESTRPSATRRSTSSCTSSPSRSAPWVRLLLLASVPTHLTHTPVGSYFTFWGSRKFHFSISGLESWNWVPFWGWINQAVQ